MKLLEDGGLMITDLDGLTELFESGCNVCGIYIHADQEVRLQRALNRPGFKQEEYERRNADDLNKFAIERIVELGTRYPVYAVDNSNAPAEEVAERVHRILVRDELKALLDSIKE
jgi:dephospho-CoA kinase